MGQVRDILFRGKQIYDGEFVYGWYERYPFGSWPLKACIVPADDAEDGYYEHVEVDMETVGQYTGLTDKNGVKIFEGDIVQVENPKPFLPYTASVVYENSMFIWGVYRLGEFKHQDKLEVIGNIHDNFELLNGGDHAQTN